LKVKIKFFASLREITGTKEEDLEVPEQITLLKVLELLSSKHGKDFYGYVYDARTKKPKDHLQFLIDGRSATMLQKLETKLTDGSILAILPPVGGG
jgi:molybdopterin synthase sulfur carrier subunit